MMSKFYTMYDVIFYSSNAVLVMHTLMKTVICIAVETTSFLVSVAMTITANQRMSLCMGAQVVVVELVQQWRHEHQTGAHGREAAETSEGRRERPVLERQPVPCAYRSVAVGLNTSHTCPCSHRAYQLVETSLHGFSGLFVVQLLAASSPFIGASQLNVDDLWTSMYGSGGSQVCNILL